MQNANYIAPGWMKLTLILAGIYNLAWGIITVVWPELYFTFSKMEVNNYPEIWQCVGMIVGVYGIGYLIAAFHPYKHWPIVFVGLLGKVLGPIGFVNAHYKGTFTLAAGLTNITNDLIWWIPFTIILVKANRFYHPKEISTNRN